MLSPMQNISKNSAKRELLNGLIQKIRNLYGFENTLFPEYKVTSGRNAYRNC